MGRLGAWAVLARVGELGDTSSVCEKLKCAHGGVVRGGMQTRGVGMGASGNGCGSGRRHGESWQGWALGLGAGALVWALAQQWPSGAATDGGDGTQ